MQNRLQYLLLLQLMVLRKTIKRNKNVVFKTNGGSGSTIEDTKKHILYLTQIDIKQDGWLKQF